MARYIDAELLKEVVLGWEPPLDDEQLEREIDTMPTADVAEVKQIASIRNDLKWWLETNTEKGVVYIPEFTIEKMIAKMDGGKEE